MSVATEFLSKCIHVSCDDPDLSRKGVILNVILIITFILSASGLMVHPFVDASMWIPGEPFLSPVYIYSIMGLSSLLLFTLNHLHYIRAASIFYIAIITMTIYTIDAVEHSVGGRNMIALVLPIVMAGLVLTPVASFYIAGAIGTVSTLLSYSAGDIPNFIGVAIYLALALVSWLTTRHLEQAIGNLRHTNSDLDQRVHDRTLELQLINARMQNEIGERKLTQLALQEERLLLERRVQMRTAEISKANVELVRLSKVKDEFLANMSHELRTPLNAIIGYSENMLEEAEIEDDLDGYYADDIKRIQQAGSHLLRLINDILDLSKLEANKMNLSLSTFNVQSLVDYVVDSVQPMIDKHYNELIVDNEVPDLVMHSDEQKITQVLLNLTSNAAKFTQAGQIVLSVSLVEEGFIKFEVADSGVGIHKDALSTIFESFRQAENSKSRSFEGTGLGLTISKRFVQMMGGTLEVESEVGVGSTFSTVLPIHLEKASEKGTNIDQGMVGIFS